jgi:pilus assembly protein CpaB
VRQRRLWIILLLALMSGGSAAYLALAYLRDRTPRLMAAEAPRSQVAVAARDLPIGTIVAPADLRMIDWRGDAVPPGYVSNPETVIGRGLITPLRTNELVMEAKFAPRGAGGGLAITIPEGLRGVSVRVDDVIGVAGFVLPGTRVDVILTLPPKEERKETVTQVVLQNVSVLAAGQIVQQDAQGKPITVSVITVLVSPEDGEKLILAANQGRIQLALRNSLDLAQIETNGARERGLLPGVRSGAVRQAVVRSATPEASGTVVEAYKGGVRTLIKF